MTAPRNPRYESLDVWRGVACLLVVAFHATNGYFGTDGLRQRMAEEGGSTVDWLAVLTSDLWIGVPLFFVISGYCIAAAADSARRKPHPVRRFLVRRFRRIYPPLWAFLAGSVLLLLATPAAVFPAAMETLGDPIAAWGDLKPGNWFGMVTLTEEWRPHLGGPPKRYLFGHLWTLCYEEQFYLVAGLLVLVARRWFFAGVAAVTAGVVVVLAAGKVYPGFFFDGLWLVFAAGVAVYYRVNYATPVIRRCLDFAFAGLFVANAGAFRSWVGFQPGLASYTAVGGGFALLLGLLHRHDAAVAGVKALAPLKFCGRMCYSLYLVHAPITVYVAWNCYRLGVTDSLGTLLVTLPLGVGLSILAGWLFHRLVEVRFMSATHSPRLKPTEQAAPACITRFTRGERADFTSPVGSGRA